MGECHDGGARRLISLQIYELGGGPKGSPPVFVQCGGGRGLYRVPRVQDVQARKVKVAQIAGDDDQCMNDRRCCNLAVGKRGRVRAVKRGGQGRRRAVKGKDAAATLRDECLSEEIFDNLADARRTLAQWRYDHKNVRPHSSLGNKSPAEARRALAHSEGSAPGAHAAPETTTINHNDFRFERGTTGGQVICCGGNSRDRHSLCAD